MGGPRFLILVRHSWHPSDTRGQGKRTTPVLHKRPSTWLFTTVTPAGTFSLKDSPVPTLTPETTSLVRRKVIVVKGYLSRKRQWVVPTHHPSLFYRLVVLRSSRGSVKGGYPHFLIHFPVTKHTKKGVLFRTSGWKRNTCGFHHTSQTLWL